MRFDMNADMRSSKLIQTHQIEWQTMQIKQSHCWTVRFGFGQKKWTRWKSTIHSPLHVPLSSKRVIMCFSYRFFSLYMYSYCVRVYYIFFLHDFQRNDISLRFAPEWQRRWKMGFQLLTFYYAYRYIFSVNHKRFIAVHNGNLRHPMWQLPFFFVHLSKIICKNNVAYALVSWHLHFPMLIIILKSWSKLVSVGV